MTLKVLQVNVVYKKGSTGKIVYDIHTSLLAEGIESIVCYGRGSTSNEIGVYKLGPELLMKLQSLRSRITGYAYSGCFLSTLNLIRIIKREKPTVVHLHCLNGYFINIYKILNFLKKNQIKTVLTLHAEFMYTAGCGYALECEKWQTGCINCQSINIHRPKSYYFDRSNNEWNMMKSCFENFVNLTICPVSPWVESRVQKSPFLQDKNIKTITNGVDTNLFRYKDAQNFKSIYQLDGYKVILHVTPDFTSPIKGGKYVLEIAKKLLKDKIKIIIIGFRGDKGQLPSNVIAIENIADQEQLSLFYSLANVTLLTSLKETFSMVCAESLCCGTPVIGFQAGAPETIAIKEYSDFVEQGDIDKLQKTIVSWINKDDICKEEISRVAAKKYSKENMSQKYIEIYNGE